MKVKPEPAPAAAAAAAADPEDAEMSVDSEEENKRRKRKKTKRAGVRKGGAGGLNTSSSSSSAEPAKSAELTAPITAADVDKVYRTKLRQARVPALRDTAALKDAGATEARSLVHSFIQNEKIGTFEQLKKIEEKRSLDPSTNRVPERKGPGAGAPAAVVATGPQEDILRNPLEDSCAMQALARLPIQQVTDSRGGPPLNPEEALRRIKETGRTPPLLTRDFISLLLREAGPWKMPEAKGEERDFPACCKREIVPGQAPGPPGSGCIGRRMHSDIWDVKRQTGGVTLAVFMYEKEFAEFMKTGDGVPYRDRPCILCYIYDFGESVYMIRNGQKRFNVAETLSQQMFRVLPGTSTGYNPAALLVMNTGRFFDGLTDPILKMDSDIFLPYMDSVAKKIRIDHSAAFYAPQSRVALSDEDRTKVRVSTAAAAAAQQAAADEKKNAARLRREARLQAAAAAAATPAAAAGEDGKKEKEKEKEETEEEREERLN